MAEGHAVIEVSTTEMPQFRRLVAFLADVETLADEQVIEGDTRLREIVEKCFWDLGLANG